MKIRTAGILGIIFAGLTIVFVAVALACNWELNSTTSSAIPPVTDRKSYSLWRACRKVYSEQTRPVGTSVQTITNVTLDECYPISDAAPEGKLTTISIIRILLFVAIGSLSVAMVTGVIRHFALKTWLHQTLQTTLSAVMAGLCFLSGTIMVGAFSVYKEEVMQEGSSGQVALYFSLVAWLLAWTSALFFFCGHMCCETKIYN